MTSLTHHLTDDQLIIFRELILRNLQVERSRSFPDAARDVVVRTVARAKPTTKVTSFTDGDTT
jgi:hypothetical protein